MVIVIIIGIIIVKIVAKITIVENKNYNHNQFCRACCLEFHAAAQPWTMVASTKEVAICWIQQLQNVFWSKRKRSLFFKWSFIIQMFCCVFDCFFFSCLASWFLKMLKESALNYLTLCQVLDLLQQMGSEDLQPNVGFPRVLRGHPIAVVALVVCLSSVLISC